MRGPIEIVPAIDLRGGHAVRLERGDLARETRYDADPVERARLFVAAGATSLHVVDLDGAFGSGSNMDALRAICAAVNVPVQTGGGVRSEADLRARFDAGAQTVVIGTMLVEEPEIAAPLAAAFGSQIVAGIDARGDRVATRGWVHENGMSRDELVKTVAAWGIPRIVFTEIERDGTGSGYDIEALAHVAGLTDLRVTASGGANTIDDLLALRAGTPSNVDRAIVGRALYEGTIDLAEAIAALNA